MSYGAVKNGQPNPKPTLPYRAAILADVAADRISCTHNKEFRFP